jgi:hypothetical protein
VLQADESALAAVEVKDTPDLMVVASAAGRRFNLEVC